MTPLKPCPWCKKKPKSDYDSYNLETSISCRNVKCRIQPETLFYQSEADAIAAWNNRKGDET